MMIKNKIPPNAYTILPPWQPSSQLIIPLWTNHPNAYPALSALAAQILPHFTPSE